VRTYDAAGRLAQACGHRIALAALQPKVVASAGAAIRCLRGLGREQDAQLIARALPDDATRATAEKLATVAPIGARATGDLVVAAHWDAGADLDLTIVTPDGSRVSWMGGRTDAVVTDATSAEREQLAIKAIKRGNYLVEIGRGKSSTAVARGAVRGTLDVTLLGQRRTMQFELTGARAVVGHLGVTLQEQMVDENGTPVYRNYGEPGWDQGRPRPRPRPTRRTPQID
nr:hypothetical protein [Deltaproteobacteria bacterium]